MWPFQVHVHSTCQQPVTPYVYILTSVDVTCHLIVSVSVFRWRKRFASQNNMFYMFCLTAHSAFTISWLLHDVPLVIWPIISHHSILRQVRNWIYRVYLSIKYSSSDAIQRLEEKQTLHTVTLISDRPKRGYHENIHIRITCFRCKFSVILSATKAKDKIILVSLLHKCCGFKLIYSWEWQRQKPIYQLLSQP